MIEALESRKLLTAVVTLDADVVRIVGDVKNDVVTAQLTGANTFTLTVNGTETQAYNFDDIDHIEFEAGAGSDSITLGRVEVPLFAAGGKGDDSISASSGYDTLSGGGGEDYIFGGNGDDLIDGGVQGDVMMGSGGSDRILGGSTNTLDDFISGGDGDDSADFSLYSAGRVKIIVGRTVAGDDVSDVVLGDIEYVAGTSSNDIITTIAGKPITIQGLGGNDQLTGGRGNDSLDGGAGDDALTGNPGNDIFDLRGGGNDQVFGGRGEDSVVGNDAGDTLDSVENS